MKTIAILALIMVVFFGVLSTPVAEVPRLINYQGFLTDASEVPIDGPHNLTFKIYADSSQSAQALWTELHVSVDIDEGLFNVILGGTTTIADSVVAGSERWMGITVDSDPEMTPRMQITSVPWALRAAVADSAIAVPAGIADGHSLDAADGDPVDALYVDDDGNVGIGTTGPGTKVEVVGTITTTGFKMPTGATAGYALVTDGNGVGTWQQVGSGGSGDITAVYALDGLWSPDSGESGDVHLYVLALPGSGLMVDPVDGVMIEPEGVTEDKIAANAVTAAKLDSAAVTSGKLAAQAVSSSALASAAVTNDKLASLAVADTNLRSNSVTNDKLLDGAVNRDKLFDLAVNTAKLDTNAVTSGKIQDNTILFDDVAQNGASEGQIMKWVGGEWVARDDSLGSGTITGVWGGAGLSGGGTTGPVTLDVDSIVSAMIVDGAVTTAKLDADAVTSAKILNNSILFEDMNQNDASEGKVMKWVSGQWVARDDSVGGNGTITEVWGGTGLLGGGTSGSVTLDVHFGGSGTDTTVSRSDHDHDAAYVNEGQDSSVTSAMIIDAAVLFEDIAQNGAADGQVMKWSDTAASWIAANDSVGSGGSGSGGWADDGVVVRLETASDSVGIGTATPTEKLDVMGNIRAIGKATFGPGNTNAGLRAFVAGEDNEATGDHSTIGGGMSNRARGEFSVISGGGGMSEPDSNSAVGDYCVIGGGSRNEAGSDDGAPEDGAYATVSGGLQNRAREEGTTVGGGSENVAGQPNGGPPYDGKYATVGGGRYNRARGKYSVVSGGGSETSDEANTAYGEYSVVGGGRHNTAGDTLALPSESYDATVSGGYRNAAYSPGTTVGGGSNNTAGQLGGGGPPYDGEYATVCGGRRNIADGSYSVVSGGGGETVLWSNRAFSDYSVVGGGSRNIAGDTLTSPSDDVYATVGGGYDNQAHGEAGTIGGGAENVVGEPGGGGPDDYGDYATIGGGRYNRARGKYSVVGGGGSDTGPFSNRAESNYSVVGGGENNVAGEGPPESNTHATISGGFENQAQEQYSTVCGGSQNESSGNASAVGGGDQNTASSSHSTVSGGSQNTASGPASTVGGGSDNYATDLNSTVPGGWSNAAQGTYSFAAGNMAKALHDGSIVISANMDAASNDSVWTGQDEQMVLRADGGFYLTDQSEQATSNGLLNTSTGAWLSGAGQWRDASDKNLKENFTDVDKDELLAKVAALPVTQWNYKVDNDETIHIGPVAQDFFAAFGVGDDDTSLSALDVAGISLVAIQELSKRDNAQKEEIKALKTQLSELQKLVRALIEQQNERRGE